MSRATIERDIAVLRQWGQVKRKGGKFGLAEMKFLPTSFTPPEALALRLAGTTFAAQAGAAYKGALTSALKKIDLVLPRRIAAEIKKAGERVSVGLPVVRDFSAEMYQSLQSAIIRHHPVDITYFSRSRAEPTKRRVDPVWPDLQNRSLVFSRLLPLARGHPHVRPGPHSVDARRRGRAVSIPRRL